MFGESAQARANKQKENPNTGYPLYALVMYIATPAFTRMEALTCVCTPGMGCFWGAERLFWRLPGVFSTQVGYAGGFTPNPNYHEVCSGTAPLLICMPSPRRCVLKRWRAPTLRWRRQSGLLGCPPPPPTIPPIRSVRVQGSKEMQRLGAGGGWSGGDV